MICTLSVMRVDDSAAAEAKWRQLPDGVLRAYVLRRSDDPEQLVTLTFFDEVDNDGANRASGHERAYLAGHMAEVLVDGTFDRVDELRVKEWRSGYAAMLDGKI